MSFNLIDKYNLLSKDFYSEKVIKKIEKKVKKTLYKDKYKWKFDIILLNSDEMRNLNLEYREIDKTTDVLSFPYNDIDGKEAFIGEIYIDVNQMKKQSLELGHSSLREFCFLVTHGLIHLNDIDHERSTDEEKMMSELQNKILDEVKIFR